MMKNLSGIAACTLGSLLAVGLVGCDDVPESVVVPVQHLDAESNVTPKDEPDDANLDDGAAGGIDQFDELSLRFPAGWKAGKMSPMRKSVLLGLYEVPGVHKDIELTISRARGGIDANFDRWKGQFTGGATPEEQTIDGVGVAARVLQLNGNFAPGMGRPPRESWMMLGAAIPGPTDDFYIKLTGPVDSVTKVRKDFEEILSSASVN